MRVHVRFSLLALLVGAIVIVSAPAAQAAVSPAIEKFVAVNCEEEKCAQQVTKINLGAPFGEQEYVEPKAPSQKEAEEHGALHAGQRVPFGITDFKVATEGSLPTEKPTGGAAVSHIRTDVAPGLATDPFAVPQCSLTNFGDKEAFPGSGLGFYTAPNCAGSEIGENKATVYLGSAGIDLALTGTAYNLDAANGLASEFGVALKLPKALSGGAIKQLFEFLEAHGQPVPSGAEQKVIEEQQYYAHTLIEGNVEWGQQTRGTNAGDYHDYFEINVSTALPLISSRLVFEGTKGEGDFITNATSCPGHNTTTLTLAGEGGSDRAPYTTPVGLSGCESLRFEPTFNVLQSTTQNDQPDEITAEASEPHNPTANDESQVKSASITLPEGMTLNPSAAHGLEACTPAQARIHSETFGVACPASSRIGTVTLDVPTLPNGSLTGAAYLGGPESGPITGPPYTMYVVANSERFGVSVRLLAEVIPNEATGQLTTVFPNPPEQPFSNLAVHFDRGMLAPVANSLVCGTGQGATNFVPTAAPFIPDHNVAFGVSVTGCASPLPFSLAQSTENETANAGGHTSYTFNLARGDGQQYLQKITTTLPAGLVGAIPAVTLCGEPQAALGTCGASSKIGTATVTAGAGNFPFTFTGPVYMTGPYNGAPFGLSIAVPAVAGPFNLGTVVTRSTINIDKTTARVTAESTLPTIVKGVPLRLRSISVNVNKQGFLFNPTNCTQLATETSLASTFGAVQTGLSSPFQVANCGALAFKPTFKATTSGKFSKAKGASIETTINMPAGGANVKSVKVQLPKQLPSRLTTLQKACLQATFAANPASCPEGSMVGTARANTPTLPAQLKGTAYLVSHAGLAFPDLDLVLDANGVRVILIGNTDIKKGITTTTFASTPDVPVSSVTVNLPLGPHSALAAFGDLCTAKLIMPTTIIGQNGTQFKQNTKIGTSGCGVRIVGHKVIGNTAYLTIKTFAAGRITGTGKGISKASRSLSRATERVTLKLPLSSSGRSRHRPFSVKLRVGFVPKKGSRSSASVTVRFH
jgi:hypothetical protein